MSKEKGGCNGNLTKLTNCQHLVKEFEGPVVNVDLLKGEIVLQTLKEVRHAWLDLRALQRLVFQDLILRSGCDLMHNISCEY